MLTQMTVDGFLRELASSSPAPGGGSVAALSAATGAALTGMVCRLTIGKKKYAAVEEEMNAVLRTAGEKQELFTSLVERDTAAFNKVMEAYSLPKETDAQKALRGAAILGATKEATLIPLEVMRHAIDTLALTRTVAEKGNVNSVSDAGVAALMLHAACEGAAFNVQINLRGITETEFVGWHADEMQSLLRTARMQKEEILGIVAGKIG
ncbi:MAG TPA: cyclodeaminase/cyclohydrolase family protein [Bacteroidota bacterium]|nr:cyclodeaminase/cyclohydrolase family protein [Bacteroidota bacterium]